MINLKQLKRFCCEDISLIENYDKAVADNTKYDCHHRLETDKGYSKQELIEMGLYYKRPANELIFLTHGEHTKLHNKGKILSEEHKRKIGKGNLGKKRSIEEKQRNAEWHKGKTPWNKGIKLSETHKINLSLSHKGKYVGDKHPSARKVYQIDKNTGEIIKEWSCMKLAAETFGLTKSAISNCCRGKSKTSGGFIWRYADNKKEQD